jgi:N-acetylglucosaminyldiphosphoundecaprenol N-acetyl-beta-D-mannosaminyltransferase
MTARPPALIFGIPIDDLTMGETLDLVGDLVVEGRRERSTRQIATVNVDFLVNALSNMEARRVLQQADVCLADGMPVVWAARSAGMPLQERVAGSDLVPELARRAETTGWKIHLFGSSETVAERAERLLLERHPGIQLTAVSGPIMARRHGRGRRGARRARHHRCGHPVHRTRESQAGAFHRRPP